MDNLKLSLSPAYEPKRTILVTSVYLIKGPSEGRHMSRVSRREDEFYSMFSEFSALIVSTAKLFVTYIESFPSSEDYEVQIKNYETLCDDQVGKIISTLNTSFITPFDREDISRLALLMDEIPDGIESVSAHLSMYDIKEMRPEAVQVAHLILFASEELQKAFERLPDYHKDDSAIRHTRSANEYEDQGDVVYRNALSSIFRNVKDPIDVLKWKSLLDRLESTLDACKHVANAVQNVIVKNG